MKWILLLSLCLFPQEKKFIVVETAGGAYLKRNPANTLKKGDQVFLSDAYQFKHPPGFVRLAGPGGTLTLPSSHDPRKDPERSAEFWMLVKNELTPTRTVIVMRGKAGMLASLNDIRLYFGRFSTDSVAMLVMDTTRIEISNTLLSTGGEQFFFLTWDYQGRKINSPIPSVNEKGQKLLLFDRSLLYVKGKETGVTEINNATLNLYDTIRKESKKLTSVNIRFAAFKDIKTELSLVAANTNVQNHDEAIKETYNYLLAYYGVMEEKVFRTKYYPRLELKL